MSTPHLIVKGIKPADDKYKKMLTVLTACQLAGIDPPSEVKKYFGDYEEYDPNPLGIEVELISTNYSWPGINKVSREMYTGYTIDIRKIDPDIKILEVGIHW